MNVESIHYLVDVHVGKDYRLRLQNEMSKRRSRRQANLPHRGVEDLHLDVVTVFPDREEPLLSADPHHIEVAGLVRRVKVSNENRTPDARRYSRPHRRERPLLDYSLLGGVDQGLDVVDQMDMPHVHPPSGFEGRSERRTICRCECDKALSDVRYHPVIPVTGIAEDDDTRSFED